MNFSIPKPLAYYLTLLHHLASSLKQRGLGMNPIGLLAVTASLMIIVIGLPAQIIKNYRRKSCEGIAPPLIYSAFLTYAFWSLYGWTKPDWFIAIAQTPGCVITFIIILQLLLYRKKGV